jgi:hypothetical protein
MNLPEFLKNTNISMSGICKEEDRSKGKIAHNMHPLVLVQILQK